MRRERERGEEEKKTISLSVKIFMHTQQDFLCARLLDRKIDRSDNWDNC